MNVLPAYAVVRVDTYDEPPEASPSNISVSVDVTVKKVLWSQEAAEAEVKRLNDLDSDKRCRYFWQYTRVDPPPPDAS
jgi:hypothetical protein